MRTRVRETATTLRGKLIAAVATPMRSTGETDAAVTQRYFDSVLAAGADGLAVAVHTGRGPLLDLQTKVGLVESARRATPLVIAGINTGDTSEWPVRAAEAGATALLVNTPPGIGVQETLDYYSSLWDRAQLPLIAFDLYANPYELAELRLLLDHPAVAAFKPARLYDAVAAQDGIAAALERDLCVLTGEDRMFGPSLMWGALGALVGIAASNVAVSAALLRTHNTEDAAAFLAASAAVDEFAAVTFRQPWDGYVQRMLWVAVDEGIIPEEMAFDPTRAPDLSDAERSEVIEVARRTRAAVQQLNAPRP